MGQIASAAMERLTTLAGQSGQTGQGVDPVGLARALMLALDEKHILAYMTDPQAAAFLRTRKWDGGLPDWLAASDTLMVVDSNVGFNKVDPNVERAIHYQVDWPARLGHNGDPIVHNTANNPLKPVARSRPERPMPTYGWLLLGLRRCMKPRAVNSRPDLRATDGLQQIDAASRPYQSGSSASASRVDRA
jgi:hypothetical protein